MTKLDALKALAEKVEAGDTEAVRELIVHDDESFDPRWLGVGRIMEGSLDAAKALMGSVLPEDRWEWQVSYLGAKVGFDGLDGYAEFVVDDRSDPARAWLLCILKALIWKEEQ